jgi:adenylate cyclase
MPELLAHGRAEEHFWRRTLPSYAISLGRTSKSDWQVPWDKRISGLHAMLIWQDDKLLVRREPTAVNEIFFRGAASDEFSVAIGEQFVIGSTTFTVLDNETIARSDEDNPDLAELTCSRDELLEVKYTDTDKRMEVLASLPGLIRNSRSEQELESRVLDVLLHGIPLANAAALVWLDPETSADNPEVKVQSVARRLETGKTERTGELQPSRRLIVNAIRHRSQGVMYSRPTYQRGGSITSSPAVEGGINFTLCAGVDWAICAPLLDDPTAGRALYVEGYSPGTIEQPESQARQKSDLKFAELVTDIYGAVRQVRELQWRESTLACFLSRRVRSVLAERDMAEALRQRETEITVLFCDLRGSSLMAEESEHELILSCARVNEALSIMTTNIIDKDGVIGDFQGDSAMGFWGWPPGGDNHMELAARAALAIRRDMSRAAQKVGHPLAGFTCGLGIASGIAVAGQVGTLDQFKFGVFGPVVNLAARLESMTKLLHVAVLADERVAEHLSHARHSHWVRVRRVARIQPFGMRRNLVVSELLPPDVEPGAMKERVRRDYEAALSAFLASRWDDARRLLEDRVPADVGIVLRQFMDRHGQKPPPDWNGVIELETK